MGGSRRSDGPDAAGGTQRRTRARAAPARGSRADAQDALRVESQSAASQSSASPAAARAAAHAAVRAAVRAIPAGDVAAYGVVARRAGLPGRARLVARVLAESSEHDLPWHRVLRADGCIAFPQGSEAFLTQCARLRAEGVDVDARGRVRVARRATTLDEALWGDA